MVSFTAQLRFPVCCERFRQSSNFEDKSKRDKSKGSGLNAA